MTVTKLPNTLLLSPGGGGGLTDGTYGEIVVTVGGTVLSLTETVKDEFAPASLVGTVNDLDALVAAGLDSKADDVHGHLVADVAFNTFWETRLATTSAETDLEAMGFLEPPAEWEEGFLKVVDDGEGNLVVDVATVLDFYGPDGTDVAVADGGTGASTALGAVNNLTVGMASVSLTDGATITPDFSTGRNFHVTLAGNRTLANPTNQVAGQSGRILVTQDGTGSRTLAYGANWRFPGGAPTLSTGAADVDMICYDVHASGTIYATLIKDFTA